MQAASHPAFLPVLPLAPSPPRPACARRLPARLDVVPCRVVVPRRLLVLHTSAASDMRCRTAPSTGCCSCLLYTSPSPRD
eukprot:7205528-Alexandrium_andersonii.AAC.1